jgi:hypothetical protein
VVGEGQKDITEFMLLHQLHHGEQTQVDYGHRIPLSAVIAAPLGIPGKVLELSVPGWWSRKYMSLYVHTFVTEVK